MTPKLEYKLVRCKTIFKNRPSRIYFCKFLILPLGNQPSEGLLNVMAKEYNIFFICDGFDGFSKLFKKDNGMDFYLLQ